MNLSGSPSYTSQALFGPHSQRIDVNQFIQAANPIPQSSTHPTVPGNPAIAAECSVDNIRNTIEDVLSDPYKHAHILRAHEKAVQSIRASSNLTKKQCKDADDDNGGLDQPQAPARPDVASLASSLSAISLSCWPYPPQAALFTRQPKNSDLNALRTIKKTGQPTSQRRDRQDSTQARRHHNLAPSSTGAPDHLQRSPSQTDTNASQGGNEVLAPEAVIVVSVYTRLSWNTQFARLSQHAVLSSQTLGDLYDVIPCSSNEIPTEGRINGTFAKLSNFINQTAQINADAGAGVGADAELSSAHQGAVICIENIAYGDGQSEEDYSDKLLKHLAEASTEKTPNPQLTKGPPMHSVYFRDLSLRINAPYWLLHQGSCDHFLVVDCIRLLHPSDPQPLNLSLAETQPADADEVEEESEEWVEQQEGTRHLYPYPLTLHISPLTLDLCQACSRVPAIQAVTGDVRLGQSPFKICGPCWRCFGEPTEEEREGRKVVVAPLVKHEHGW